MSEYFTVGLQTGRNVTKVVDKFIKMYDFKSDKRKDLTDGTTIYEWYVRWCPCNISVEQSLLDMLKTFDNKEKAIDNAYKMLCVGDEGSEDEYGNYAGFYNFNDLCKLHTVEYPELWEEESKKPNLTKELPACIIDIFEDFLEKKNVWIPNEDVDEEIKKADEYSCKEEARKEMGLANIYGEDFDYLMEQLMSTFDNFGIPVEDKWT